MASVKAEELDYFPKYDELKGWSDEEVIRRFSVSYQSPAAKAFYLTELNFRHQQRTNEEMKGISKEMNRMTKRIAILTLANVILVTAGIFLQICWFSPHP